MSASAGQVTIGVPIYRGEEFLEETLRCIQAQRHPEFNVLMSMDEADPVCERICAKFLKDPRFKLVVQPQRLGWVGNLNCLLEQVATEFWYFHQQDDLTAPEYLEVLVEHARQNPDAALVYSDLLPMGRIEGSFVQPSSVRGATPYIRMMSALHEQFPAFAFRGLTRLSAVREAGPIPTNEVDDFGVDMCWLTGVARAGELLHVPQPLYRKRYHTRNTESKWWAWPQKTRLHAWAEHCVNMLEQVLRIKGSPQELRMLLLGATERLTSPQVASHFLRLDQLTKSDRQLLFDCFLDGIQRATNWICLVCLRRNGAIFMIGRERSTGFLATNHSESPTSAQDESQQAGPSMFKWMEDRPSGFRFPAGLNPVCESESVMLCWKLFSKATS